MNAIRQNALAAYGAVTAAYWAFMLTDGALRMLVLLHFHILGFSPVQLAYLFVLYEIAGVITNLTAGWLAARFGLRLTLYSGLSLQIFALIALTALNPEWSMTSSVVFVMLVQGLSGVAKDLTKMSAKSSVKMLAPQNGDGLFRWVAILTGSKNAIKGLGFFIGAALLARLGFLGAIWVMVIALTAVFIAVVSFLPKDMTRGDKSAKFTDIFSKSANINWLSAARVFLFGARDIWFVVGIPIYFYAVLSDGSAQGNKAAFFWIGSFMAAWIILYGAVQSFAPKVLRAKTKTTGQLNQDAVHWALGLGAIPFALCLLLLIESTAQLWLTAIITVALLIFGVVFAVNSSLHSYLILAFTKSQRVTMDVGFYYMANAAGRLLGTLLSGLCYQIGGLALVMGMAALFIFISAGFAKGLRP